ncbi:hypothetical protein QJQ45_013803 [Haematococcus lacustris]|nr:hypothetical protein QJQ45_013803 [Haematococcus lacustris]
MCVRWLQLAIRWDALLPDPRRKSLPAPSTVTYDGTMTQELSMAVLFGTGYLAIIAEELLGLEKAAIALLMAAGLWSIRAAANPQVVEEVGAALGEVSQVIFFLMGALTIVEVVDSHQASSGCGCWRLLQGFKIITDRVSSRSKRELLWLVGLMAFMMSSVLDNLTTTIVMVSLLRKLCPQPDTRLFMGGVVVMAANAGGAWTPIGDITTTMLWVGGQISTVPTLVDLALPSAVCLLLPMAGMSAWAAEVQGSLGPQEQGTTAPLAVASLTPLPQGSHTLRPSTIIPQEQDSLCQQLGVASSHAASHAADKAVRASSSSSPGMEHVGSGQGSGVEVSVASRPIPRELNLRGRLVLSLGLGSLLLVPCFKALTGLPPYLGMLAGLGFMWLFVDALHYGEPPRWALKRIDTEGVLFFLGILLSVASLEAAGLLQELAQVLDQSLGSTEALAVAIGLASALVDNVPLVAAAMGMYSLDQYPVDDRLWQLVAYAAGTGGSLLIIGSASGVAFMGLEQARFGWYLQRITPWALLGYGAGLATYMALHAT